jgi:hypothetical protein
MRAIAYNLTLAFISAALVIIVVLAMMTFARSEPQLCQLERGSGDGWHYRTAIAPNAGAKCWYVGPRMKSRAELYWAEAPAIPMLQVDRPPWADPKGWEHKE